MRPEDDPALKLPTDDEVASAFMTAGLAMFWSNITEAIMRGFDLLQLSEKKLVLGWSEELVNQLRKEVASGEQEKNSGGSRNP